MVASYQWLDCNDSYAGLIGKTFRTFYGLTDGDYAVEVTYYGCKDTSDCFNISTSGIRQEVNNVSTTYSGYPNPTIDQFTINVNNMKESDLEYQLYDITGKVLLKGEILDGKTIIFTNNIDQAIYFVKIMKENTVMKTIKMIKK